LNSKGIVRTLEQINGKFLCGEFPVFMPDLARERTSNLLDRDPKLEKYAGDKLREVPEVWTSTEEGIGMPRKARARSRSYACCSGADRAAGTVFGW
jgi:hypothetical protein